LIEAKAIYKSAADAVQQARTYAEMLGLKFAYAINGPDIIEIGQGVKPDVADRLLTPFNHTAPREMSASTHLP
jgi:type I restriction enzyme R subunit